MHQRLLVNRSQRFGHAFSICGPNRAGWQNGPTVLG